MLMYFHANVQKAQTVIKPQLEISTLPHAAIGAHLFAPLIPSKVTLGYHADKLVGYIQMTEARFESRDKIKQCV